MLGKGYMGFFGIVSYNWMWIYDHPQIKDLTQEQKLCIPYIFLKNILSTFNITCIKFVFWLFLLLLVPLILFLHIFGMLVWMLIWGDRFVISSLPPSSCPLPTLTLLSHFLSTSASVTLAPPPIHPQLSLLIPAFKFFFIAFTQNFGLLIENKDLWCCLGTAMLWEFWQHCKCSHRTSRWTGVAYGHEVMVCLYHVPRSSASHKAEEPGGSIATFIYSHFMGQRAVLEPMASHSKPLSNPSFCGEVWLPYLAGIKLCAFGTKFQKANSFSPIYVFISGQFLVNEDLHLTFEPRHTFLVFYFIYHGDKFGCQLSVYKLNSSLLP